MKTLDLQKYIINDILKIIDDYSNISDYLNKADRRKKDYKIVLQELEKIKNKHGENSKEVSQFFLINNENTKKLTS